MADEHRDLLGLVTRDLRRQGLKETGREGLPAEAVLRCALLKQHRQLSYQELAFHLEDSASFRAFARLPCWGGRLPTASQCARMSSFKAQSRETVRGADTRIGMDTSKSIFQLHGVNAAEQPILRKKLSRREMVKFFEKAPPTTIALEACGGAHHWARLLASFGHEVKLIAPQLAKPYVKRGKNDAADAEALCEAMSRPTMRFVPVKTADQQAALMLVGMRERLIRNRTQLANAIRGFAMEFGIVAAKGMCRIEPLLERIVG